MRTYILIGYVIISLQYLHISATTSVPFGLHHFDDLGSGDGESSTNRNGLETTEDPLFVDAEPDDVEEEVSGSGWGRLSADDYDAEEEDDYYDYKDEGSGVYPVPESEYERGLDRPLIPEMAPPFNPDPEDDFEIESDLTKAKENPIQPVFETPSFPEVNPVEKPSTTAAPTLTDTQSGMDTNIRIVSQNDEERQVSIFAQPSILAAFIGGAVMGLLCAILLVMFIVYRMRKRDEGSYPLDEPKRVPLTSSYAPNDKEIYA